MSAAFRFADRGNKGRPLIFDEGESASQSDDEKRALAALNNTCEMCYNTVIDLDAPVASKSHRSETDPFYLSGGNAWMYVCVSPRGDVSIRFHRLRLSRDVIVSRSMANPGRIMHIPVRSRRLAIETISISKHGEWNVSWFESVHETGPCCLETAQDAIDIYERELDPYEFGSNPFADFIVKTVPTYMWARVEGSRCGQVRWDAPNQWIKPGEGRMVKATRKSGGTLLLTTARARSDESIQFALGGGGDCVTVSQESIMSDTACPGSSGWSCQGWSKQALAAVVTGSKLPTVLADIVVGYAEKSAAWVVDAAEAAGAAAAPYYRLLKKMNDSVRARTGADAVSMDMEVEWVAGISSFIRMLKEGIQKSLLTCFDTFGGGGGPDLVLFAGSLVAPATNCQGVVLTLSIACEFVHPTQRFALRALVTGGVQEQGYDSGTWRLSAVAAEGRLRMDDDSVPVRMAD